VGIGIAAGVLIAKPKLDESRKSIETLAMEIQKSKAESEEVIQKASAEMAKLRAELMRANSAATQYKNDLTRAAMEIDRLKTMPQGSDEAQAAPESVKTQVSPGAVSTSPAAAPAASPAGKIPTVEYVIKEGDSFWVIAANQLGSGIRYKEILALNPQYKEDSTLVVGSKIKIPAK
jgi:nucleoid-associated protein YgaU